MYKQFIIALLTILFYFGYCEEGSTCRTPDESSGTCINIKTCDTLVQLLRTRSNDPETRTFLRRSVCGFIGTVPLVCCPVNRNSDDHSTTEGSSLRSSNNQERIELPVPPYCGSSNKTVGRVVGGIAAKLGEFPWMVALGYRNSRDPNSPKWLCGGSLITYRHVLTAAHCVDGRDDLYLARIGDLDLYDDQDGATPVNIPIITKTIYDGYNSTAHIGDVAILKLETAVDSRIGRPVCLPIPSEISQKNFDKHQVFVAGWGAIYFRGPSSAVLQLASIPVVSNDVCREKFSKFPTVTINPNVLCAGKGGKDACQGDSGGPLMYGRPNNSVFYFFQIGVVSFGYKCAEIGYPGVYARITSFMDWIRTTVTYR